MNFKKKIFLKKIRNHHINDGWLKWINTSRAFNSLSTTKKKTKREDLINFIKLSNKKGNKVFAVYDTKSKSYIGNASLTAIDYTNKHCMYGRFIGNENFFNKSYGQFMLYEICKYAFFKIKLNKCYTHVFVDNHPSIASNLKFGMKKEGILKSYILRNKKFKDVVVFSMLKKEFEKKYER